ncbi:hypothetical protein EKO04_009843 [Ascochyta lentis]|uniref:BZIP transcription factor n=1 Tax=Ascochyta lentis TaxID=205686 RepID=A0A8H7ITN6_9PLEO|nr:hypothetical protein EKO04_009843 [Ascochyta lentis]
MYSNGNDTQAGATDEDEVAALLWGEGSGRIMDGRVAGWQGGSTGVWQGGSTGVWQGGSTGVWQGGSTGVAVESGRVAALAGSRVGRVRPILHCLRLAKPSLDVISAQPLTPAVAVSHAPVTARLSASGISRNSPRTGERGRFAVMVVHGRSLVAMAYVLSILQTLPLPAALGSAHEHSARRARQHSVIAFQQPAASYSSTVLYPSTTHLSTFHPAPEAPTARTQGCTDFLPAPLQHRTLAIASGIALAAGLPILASPHPLDIAHFPRLAPVHLIQRRRSCRILHASSTSTTEPHRTTAPDMSDAFSSVPYPTVAVFDVDRRSSYPDDMSTTSSTGSVSDQDTPKPTDPTLRPRLGSRKSSGTIIIPRDSPHVELKEEEYDDGDARTMSPRRSSEEIEKMGQDARQALIEQAKQLQASLMEIVDRVEVVKSEHEKLEGGNKFLQSYIGELMQTSKLTSSGAGKATKAKGKARVVK